MASVQDKIAESLEILKQYQDSHTNLVIQGRNEIGETHMRRLLQHGYLIPVLKGWYIPSFPGSEGDTTVWYSSYWAFIASYANSRFGKDWCLTAEQSLSYYAGETVSPSQIVIRARNASNSITPLLYGDSMLSIAASLPENIVVEPRYGLRLYSLAEALVFCSPHSFKSDALNVRTCLYSLDSADDIIKIVTSGSNSLRASRIIGALQSIGRADMANSISIIMKRLGYDIRPENPFEDSAEILSARLTSPYATRIALMWQTMRKQILGMNMSPDTSKLDANAILANMEANYAKDSYHSLSIEGYRVTEGLIEQVRSGNWNPEKNALDWERKNALAARGYYQAFNVVKDSVEKILSGAPAGEIASNDYDAWHFELFQPCVSAGIVAVSDLIGYRSHQVYIRGSKHAPLNPDAVRYAMPVLNELLKNEPNAYARAILGHYFLTYIHPYMDGNGRTARFLMNVMLVTGGYPWTIIPVERRDEYMASLEKASIEGDILPFASFIASLMN